VTSTVSPRIRTRPGATRDLRPICVRQLGTRTIANQLNARGLRNRSGKPWSGHNIGRILANRVYLGEVRFRDVVTTDAHPAIIDETTFAAAQRLRDARGDKQTQRAGSDSDYHCTGLITCPLCGHKYVGTSVRGKTRRYRCYTCFSRTRYGAAGCPAGRIDADDLDTAVLQAVAHTFASRSRLLADVVARARQHHHDSHAHRRTELATVEAEITTGRAAIDRYLTAFENGYAAGSAMSSPLAHPPGARNSSRPWSPPSASTATPSTRSSAYPRRRNPRRHKLDGGRRVTVSHNGAVGGPDVAQPEPHSRSSGANRDHHGCPQTNVLTSPDGVPVGPAAARAGTRIICGMTDDMHRPVAVGGLSRGVRRSWS
jgi:hypothetical protein